jgi:hypothetical protein
VIDGTKDGLDGWTVDGVGMGWWDAPLSDVFLFLFV